jgi:hypothetical protein
MKRRHENIYTVRALIITYPHSTHDVTDNGKSQRTIHLIGTSLSMGTGLQ